MEDFDAFALLIERWHARRAWAETLLCEHLGLAEAQEVLRIRPKAVWRPIPGTIWWYKTHGVGVLVYRADETGNMDFVFDEDSDETWRLHWFIDFDFGEAPDAGRLRWFAERQYDQGELAETVYRRWFENFTAFSKHYDRFLLERRACAYPSTPRAQPSDASEGPDV